MSALQRVTVAIDPKTHSEDSSTDGPATGGWRKAGEG